MLVLVAIAFSAPMLIRNPDGTFFVEVPWESTNSNKLKANIFHQKSFYKWQEEDGTWHYSDQPQVGKNIETVTINTNTNVIQSLRIEKKKEDVVVERPSEVKADIPAMSLPMTVPLEKVSKMLDEANNIQHVMDNRNKQLEQAIDGR
jgi:hypothetical protein